MRPPSRTGCAHDTAGPKAALSGAAALLRSPPLSLWVRVPTCAPAAYLAFAMHSKVTSLDPATTLLLPGGTTMTGATAPGSPTSPAADETQVHGTPKCRRRDDWER